MQVIRPRSNNDLPVNSTRPRCWGIASLGDGGMGGRHQVLMKEFMMYLWNTPVKP